MIVLFTDFGLEGPYTGQIKAVLYQTAPAVPVIELFADAPAGRPKHAAYLLAAYGVWFPPGTVFLAVIDPGVGGRRSPVIVEAGGRWYVGPDNGLFELVVRRAGSPRTLGDLMAPSDAVGELSRTRPLRTDSGAGRPRRTPCPSTARPGNRPACRLAR